MTSDRWRALLQPLARLGTNNRLCHDKKHNTTPIHTQAHTHTRAVKEAKRYLSAQSSDMPAAGHDDDEDGGGGRTAATRAMQPSVATGTSDSV